MIRRSNPWQWSFYCYTSLYKRILNCLWIIFPVHCGREWTVVVVIYPHTPTHFLLYPRLGTPTTLALPLSNLPSLSLLCLFCSYGPVEAYGCLQRLKALYKRVCRPHTKWQPGLCVYAGAEHCIPQFGKFWLLFPDNVFLVVITLHSFSAYSIRFYYYFLLFYYEMICAKKI